MPVDSERRIRDKFSDPKRTRDLCLKFQAVDVVVVVLALLFRA